MREKEKQAKDLTKKFRHKLRNNRGTVILLK